MVIIECPHCSEDLEMDDDAYGLFECPYCSGEYEWGEAPKTSTKKKTSKYNFKSKDFIKERTRNIESSNSSNRSKSRKEYSTNLEYSALNFTSLAINTVLIFIVILGLNSNSWYGFSYSGEEFDDDGEFDANFGLSYVEFIVTEDDRETYWDEDLTYYYYGGEMQSYESQLEEAKANLEFTEEICEDWEDDDQCEIMITQGQESVDFWNSWDSSGSFLFVLLLFSLLLLIVILSCKLLVFLNHNEWLSTDDEMLNIITKIEIIATLVTSSILIIGLFMYWLFVPNIENWWDIMDQGVPSGLSSGLGFIWWVTLLTSLALIVSSTFESMAKRNA